MVAEGEGGVEGGLEVRGTKASSCADRNTPAEEEREREREKITGGKCL